MTYQYEITITLLNGNTNGSPSFLDGDVSTNVPSLSYLNDGLYDLWCIDRDTSYTLGATYNDHFAFSSTEVQNELVETPLREFSPLTSNIFNYTEKLDNVNWLINQNYINTDAFGYGIVSRANVQSAIWLLLNQYPAGTTLSANVLHLVELANTLGEGFIASANQKQGLVISNFTVNVNGETVPRTQPFLLVTQAAQLGGTTSTPLRFMRSLTSRQGKKVKKYLELAIIEPGEFMLKGLTAGFEYFFKPLITRELFPFTLVPGESATFNYGV